METVANRNAQFARLAVIGYGSLIWRLRSRDGKLKLSSGWHRDGPILPVEYARVSRNGKLSLVIISDAERQRTLWAYSGCSNLDDAKENLRKREGKVKSSCIMSWKRGSDQGDDPTFQTISKWAEERALVGVVWTALPPKDKDGNETRMPAEHALAYLSNLKSSERRAAREYIRKTPSQVDTEVRRLARDRLGWTDLQLSENLFED